MKYLALFFLSFLAISVGLMCGRIQTIVMDGGDLQGALTINHLEER